MVTTALMVWLPRSWRPQRVRRPGRCRSCVGHGSVGAPMEPKERFYVVRVFLENPKVMRCQK
jgi:hypothetical protein